MRPGEAVRPADSRRRTHRTRSRLTPTGEVPAGGREPWLCVGFDDGREAEGFQSAQMVVFPAFRIDAGVVAGGAGPWNSVFAPHGNFITAETAVGRVQRGRRARLPLTGPVRMPVRGSRLRCGARRRRRGWGAPRRPQCVGGVRCARDTCRARRRGGEGRPSRARLQRALRDARGVPALKWVGEVRTSEEAVPPDDAELLRPGDYSLRHDLVDEGFLLVMLGPAPAPLPGTPGVTLHALSCTWKKWHPVAA